MRCAALTTPIMINLLPPEEKTEIRLIKRTKTVLVLGILLTICLTSFWMVLKIAQIRIQEKTEVQNSLIKFEQNKSFQLEEIKSKIKEINDVILRINKFYKQQIAVFDVLSKTSKMLGSDVFLKTFNFDNSKKTVSFSGTIKKLASLNKMREDFYNSQEFLNMDFSIGTYVPYQDIEFKVTFSLP